MNFYAHKNLHYDGIIICKNAMSVAPIRHWVTCGSKPGAGGIFSSLALFYLSCYLSLGFRSKVSSVHVHRLG